MNKLDNFGVVCEDMGNDDLHQSTSFTSGNFSSSRPRFSVGSRVKKCFRGDCSESVQDHGSKFSSIAAYCGNWIRSQVRDIQTHAIRGLAPSGVSRLIGNGGNHQLSMKGTTTPSIHRSEREQSRGGHEVGQSLIQEPRATPTSSLMLEAIPCVKKRYTDRKAAKTHRSFAMGGVFPASRPKAVRPKAVLNLERL